MRGGARRGRRCPGLHSRPTPGLGSRTRALAGLRQQRAAGAGGGPASPGGPSHVPGGSWHGGIGEGEQAAQPPPRRPRWPKAPLCQSARPSSPTCVAGRALAGVVVPAVEAGPVVPAGPGGALVDVDLAVGALEARHAEAAVLVGLVQAEGAVPAGAGGALARLLLAAGPRVAGRAEAGEGPAPLAAGAAVQAGLAGAGGGGGLGLAGVALGGLGARPVRLRAGAGLAAGAPGAAVRSGRARLAEAAEAQQAGGPAAEPAGRAGEGGAGVVEGLAVSAHERQGLLRAEAVVATLQVQAGPAVPARRGVAGHGQRRLWRGRSWGGGEHWGQVGQLHPGRRPPPPPPSRQPAAHPLRRARAPCGAVVGPELPCCPCQGHVATGHCAWKRPAHHPVGGTEQVGSSRPPPRRPPCPSSAAALLETSPLGCALQALASPSPPPRGECAALCTARRTLCPPIPAQAETGLPGIHGSN